MSQAPGWEAAISVFGSLAAFIGLEIADSSIRKGPSQAHVDHDRNLFQRYETVLSEEQLLNELNGRLYDHRTEDWFADALHTFVRLASRGEGQYLIPSVQRAFSSYATKLSELSEFIAVNFFRPHTMRVDDADSRLALYPDHRREFDEDKARFYQGQVTALVKLLNEVEASLHTYRDVIKRELAI